MSVAVDQGPTLIVLVAVASSTTTLAVLLRCYVRLVLQHRFGAGDYLIVFSQANFCALMYSIVQEVKYGLGQHLLTILINRPGDIPKVLKSYWISVIFFIVATCSVKVSVAVFFYGLHPPRNLRIAAVATAIISVAAGLATLVASLVQCTPASYFWERFTSANPKAYCTEPHKAHVILQTVNSFNIFTDFLLAILPCIMVWNMVLSRIKKFGVSILLGVGSLSAIAAFARAFQLRHIVLNLDDFTYAAVPVTITSIAEPAIAISVVCFAHLRPLVRQIFPKNWFSISDTHSVEVVPGSDQLGRRINDVALSGIEVEAGMQTGTDSTISKRSEQLKKQGDRDLEYP